MYFPKKSGEQVFFLELYLNFPKSTIGYSFVSYPDNLLPGLGHNSLGVCAGWLISNRLPGTGGWGLSFRKDLL